MTTNHQKVEKPNQSTYKDSESLIYEKVFVNQECKLVEPHGPKEKQSTGVNAYDHCCDRV